MALWESMVVYDTVQQQLILWWSTLMHIGRFRTFAGVPAQYRNIGA